MRWSAAALLFATLAAVATGPVAGQVAVSGAVGRAAGCYDVEVGMWRAMTDQEVTRPQLPPNVIADSTSYVLPPRIRLTTQPGGIIPEQGWLRIDTPAGALPTGHRYQSWKLDGDRLLLSYSTGYVGLHAVLASRAGAFSGMARTFHDMAGTQTYDRSVTLRPVDCATPPPASDKGLRTLPRTVELEGGARLALGGARPAGLRTTPRPSGALGVTNRSTGLFAGSDSVAFRIGRNDGNVGVIQLIFPAPASGDSLIARITRDYGAPDPNTSVPGAWWHNRITQLSVIPNPAGGFRVLIQDPRSW